MAADAFRGAWLVRETVFSPTGKRLGEVIQRRAVEDAGEGGVRVVQDCRPDAALVERGHPMAAFAGDHVFTLRRDGPRRHYLGPAVRGGALCIGEGAMFGRGVWPDFGWSFESWSVVVSPERQLTGGRFHRGGVPMAIIVGVGAPQTAEGDAPELGEPRWPGEIAKIWRGIVHRIDARGEMVAEAKVERRYSNRFEWQSGGDTSTLAPRDDAFLLEGVAQGQPLCGFAHRFGWMLESEAVVGSDCIVQSTEILDERARHLVVLERWLVGQTLERASITRFRPEADG